MGLTRLLTACCRAIWTGLRYVLTFSYAGALSHYTTQPLEHFRRQQRDVVKVAVLLARFREMKQQEMSFVNQGVCIRLTCVPPPFSQPPYVTFRHPETWNFQDLIRDIALMKSPRAQVSPRIRGRHRCLLLA